MSSILGGGGEGGEASSSKSHQCLPTGVAEKDWDTSRHCMKGLVWRGTSLRLSFLGLFISLCKQYRGNGSDHDCTSDREGTGE